MIAKKVKIISGVLALLMLGLTGCVTIPAKVRKVELDKSKEVPVFVSSTKTEKCFEVEVKEGIVEFTLIGSTK